MRKEVTFMEETKGPDIFSPRIQYALNALDATLMSLLNNQDVLAALHNFRDGYYIRNPVIEFANRAKAGDYNDVPEDIYQKVLSSADVAMEICCDSRSLSLSVDDIRQLEEAMLSLADKIHNVMHASKVRDAYLDVISKEQDALSVMAYIKDVTDGYVVPDEGGAESAEPDADGDCDPGDWDPDSE